MVNPAPNHRAALLAVVAALVACGLCGQDTPPELPLARGNLEGFWRFAIDPQEAGENAGWQGPDFDDSAWRELRVPGLWEPQGITEPRPGEPPKPKGAMPWTDYDGVAWYRRTVVVPAAWQGDALLLALGCVDDVDRTFVNGTLVGSTGQGAQHPSTLARRYRVPGTLIRWGAANLVAVQVRDHGGPGGIPGQTLSLLPERELAMAPWPAEDRPFGERFRDPPGSVRILKIVHGWPAGGEEAERELLDTLQAQGFGGVVTNVAWGDDYLHNPAAWDQLRRVVAHAREKAMALWLYDEKGYPSGSAGGQVLQGHPEWEPEGLLVASAVADGPLVLALPPGALVLAAACPLDGGADATVRLEETISGGALRWTPPPGRWQVLAITRDRIYEGTHAAMNVYRHQPYVDLMAGEATARFLELTHAAYARELGADLGGTFKATFTDEPSLMSAFLSPMPYAVLPWSARLPVEFARRRGYALEPELVALVTANTARSRRVRYDFWQTVTELVREGFTIPIRDWCRAHNLPAGGHLLWEEGLRMHVPFYGDFFACLRDFDAPGIDCLTSLPPQVPWAIARLASSVAELEGRTLTMSETSDHAQHYRPAGDTRPPREVSLAEIRGTINRLMVGGINTITSYYSFAGLSSDDLARLNRTVGRCCTALRGGHQVADIAVVYPVESIWPHYDPAAHHATRNPAAQRIEQAYTSALDALFTAGRDLTILDSRALQAATVEGAELVHGALRWQVVVLPGVETLPRAAWETLASFHRAGGILISLALPPAHDGRDFPAPAVVAAAKAWFGDASGPVFQQAAGAGLGVFLPAGMESLLPSMLGRLLEPDVAVPAGGPLRVTHRRVDAHEVYFVINDGPAPFQGRVTLAVTGAGELWDPETGACRTLAGPEVDLQLDGYAGVVLRWATCRQRRRLAAGSAAPAASATADLAPVEVLQGAGEHVAAEPPVALALPDGRQAWRAVGQLRQSHVDTFLFLRLRFAQPVDGSGADFVLVDMEVPALQGSGAAAYLFAVEADGGEFLAPLGFALNEPGPHRVWLPWESLKPAGWSTSGDGILDRTRITELRIGWGGYLGREGERIEFTLAVPRLGQIHP
jgi:hypothetical protein